MAKKFRRLLNRHIQHVGDALAFVVNLQRLAVVAFALADLARHIHIRQEVHLDLDDTLALTGFAAPTLDVEGEAARLVAANARLRHLGEEFANAGEGIGVGRGIRARRAPNGRLVDIDDLIQVLECPR